MVRFRIFNCGKRMMSLRIQRDDQAQQDCLITQIEPSMTGQLQPGKFFEISLHLFPKLCGVAKINGLKFFENLNRQEIDPADVYFPTFTVEK